MDFKDTYDGSIFVNSRTITDSLKIIEGRGKDVITFSELIHVLDFIDCICLSKKIRYDALIPDKSLEELGLIINKLKKYTDLQDSNFIKYKPESSKNDYYTEVAFEDAWPITKKILTDRTYEASIPLSPEKGALADSKVHIFMQILDTRNSLIESEISGFISELKNKSGIVGKRYIINLCRAENDAEFQLFYKSINKIIPEDRGIILSKLITSYRVSLLNEYARVNNSAYQSLDYSTFQLTESKVQRTWNLVYESIQNLPAVKNLEQERNFFSLKSTLPMIGLYVLYNSNEKVTGIDLINESLKLSKTLVFDSYRKELFNSLNSESTSDYEELIGRAREFTLKSNALRREREKNQLLSIWPTLQNILLENLQGLINLPVINLANISIKINDYISRVTGERGFISFYSLQRNLLQEIEQDILADKVQIVFNRRLERQ